jgi:hypothetical protein
MSINQYFVPEEATKTTGHIYSNRSGSPIDVIETSLYEYMQKAQAYLVSQGFVFTDDEFRSIQTSSVLFDALTKTQYEWDSNFFPKIAAWHAVFNVFYKEPGSDTFTLQFANTAYLDKVGKDLSEIVNVSENDLMSLIYRPQTIASFQQAAKKWYTAQFIEMDNIHLTKDEDVPAFFWFRKEYQCPHNRWTLQVRIGMNGTGLTVAQKEKLTDLYKLTDFLRTHFMNQVSYSNPSPDALIDRIHARLLSVLNDDLTTSLSLMHMSLTLAKEIVINSPLPLTIINKQGAIECISPAYAATVGYTVKRILEPNFFDRIYPGIEGRLVKESIAAYQKNWFYPEASSFSLTRGNMFHKIEAKESIAPMTWLQFIPNLYTFDDGVVRANTVLPAAGLSWFGVLEDTRPMECFPETEPSPLESRAVAEWLKNQNL